MALLMDSQGRALDGSEFEAPSLEPAEELEIDPRVSPHKYEAAAKKVGVMIVDHGSKIAASNERLEELCGEYASTRAHKGWIVAPAHMELASPSIEDAFDSLVSQGCDLVVCHPYFLGAGRHATQDVPQLLDEANAKHPSVTSFVTPPLGAAPTLLDLVHDVVSVAVKDGGTPAPENAFEDSFFGSIAAAIAEDQTA